MSEQLNTSGKSTGADVAGGGVGVWPSPVMVTQADRDAAARIAEAADRYGAATIRAGEWDHHVAVIVCATHRIAEQERCARVADRQAELVKRLGEEYRLAGNHDDAATSAVMAMAFERAAEEIRKGGQ